ncbi:MAG TPA: class I mannose-6-phosphate isomerase [Candidatus Angelobacter sp.]|nr:class I mannose-6-phosphate isomerase [Candidatus Angelobacter sp.]
MPRTPNYDKFPFVRVSDSDDGCYRGWREIGDALKAAIRLPRSIVCVESYPGAYVDQIEEALVQALAPAVIVRAASCLKSPAEIESMLAPYLGGDDPVFGRMNGLMVTDFLCRDKVSRAQEQIGQVKQGTVLIIGTGASLIAPQFDLLVYADMARWEIQLRQRRGEIGNLGANNLQERSGLKYKRAFFVDWRAADRLKKSLIPKVDFLLDTNESNIPKLISGSLLRRGLVETVARPFRVVPYFDPGPWGGHWMEEVCGLPVSKDKPNHAWCFDCVPEENSLLLGFGDVRVEIPAINLLFSHPRELLGDAVHARFGTEFPIRFDFLDTMGGGNLSLQVHPLTEYIQDKFGMNYTQDESYYLLDAGDDGSVFLGLREDADPGQIMADLREAQNGGKSFYAERYVNRFPAKRHDHFLIPAGTIHGSGKEGMVLEISTTPYIFTFKLWDWGRLGLDGRPRPIHLDHGEANIQWDRRTDWVSRNLVGQVEQLGSGECWREERTGLHEREFIETRRHWFHGSTPHHTNGGVNVLNLVQGEEAIVESPAQSFEPFTVHYAETFIIPAAVGPYTIRPSGIAEGKECATIKAFVRTRP